MTLSIIFLFVITTGSAQAIKDTLKIDTNLLNTKIKEYQAQKVELIKQANEILTKLDGKIEAMQEMKEAQKPKGGKK